MPDIARVLKEEIQRLARKEVKATTTALRKDNAVLKRVAADHKARIAKLERDNRSLLTDTAKRRSESLEVTDKEIDEARITAKMIRAMRSKLGLSQVELAKLLDVNSQTVYQWEHKEGRLSFRGNARAAVVALRKLNRKEAQQRLEALSEDRTTEKTTRRRKKSS